VLQLFLGSIIYNKRREMSLTQIQLANDICTQNTISKIEKHNIAPTVNILIKICLKLGLTLNDVFSDFSNSSTLKEDSVLDTIERDVLLDEVADVDEKMSSLKGKLSDNDMKQYELVVGVVEYLNSNYDVALFNLDKVLQYTKTDVDDIYTLLAYLFKGLNYLRQDHNDRAMYYFKMIDESVHSVHEVSQISNANDLEVLFICKTLAKSYNEMKLYEKAYDFSYQGLNFAKERHTSYFLAELNYQAAFAIKDDDSKKQDYEDYHNLALYLAKFNKNDSLLAKLQ